MPLKHAFLFFPFASPRIVWRWVAALVFASLLSCAKAHAWTDAKVQGVHTRIELSDNSVADVAMRIKIRVRGGWLSRFEITGLDDDLTLATTRPAVLISEEGPRYIPEINQRETGELVLKFTDRKRVPRRGTYTCELRYTTASIARDLVTARNNKRYAYWSLPPWHVGIENVQIEITAPLGSRPIVLTEDESLVEQRGYRDSENQTVLHWRRVHLPRTVAWKVGFTLPKKTVVATEPAKPSFPTSSDATTRRSTAASGSWVAVLLSVFALLKRFLVTQRCRKKRVEPIPLVALTSAHLRHSSIILLTLAAFLLFDTYRVTALVLCCLVVVLSIDKNYRRLPIRQKGVWRAVRERDLQVARFAHYKSLFDFAAWFDATAPLGFALLVSNIILSFLLYWQGDGDFAYFWTCGVVLVSPLFLTGTRKNFPLSPETAVNILRDFVTHASMNRLSGSDIDCRLLLYITPTGEWEEARLRFRSNIFTDGLKQLDLVIADFSAFHAIDSDVALLSVAATGSPADRILGSRLKNAATYSASGGDRVARITRSTDFRNDIHGLLDPLLKSRPVTAQAQA